MKMKLSNKLTRILTTPAEWRIFHLLFLLILKNEVNVELTDSLLIFLNTYDTSLFRLKLLVMSDDDDDDLFFVRVSRLLFSPNT